MDKIAGCVYCSVLFRLHETLLRGISNFFGSRKSVNFCWRYYWTKPRGFTIKIDPINFIRLGNYKTIDWYYYMYYSDHYFSKLLYSTNINKMVQIILLLLVKMNWFACVRFEDFYSVFTYQIDFILANFRIYKNIMPTIRICKMKINAFRFNAFILSCFPRLKWHRCSLFFLYYNSGKMQCFSCNYQNRIDQKIDKNKWNLTRVGAPCILHNLMISSMNQRFKSLFFWVVRIERMEYRNDCFAVSNAWTMLFFAIDGSPSGNCVHAHCTRIHIVA